jgi:hypothetical protein
MANSHTSKIRLGSATKDEINAAMAKVRPDLVEIVQQWVPPLWKGMALQKLDDPRTIIQLCRLVDDAIEAVDEYRAAHPTPAPQAQT